MDHFHYKNGIYHAEDVSLPALAEKIGTPFYCYSTATLARHYQVFSGYFPSAKICFAVKANGNLAVLKTLAKLGCGADVVSEGEIRLARAAGIKASDIVFSGVGKTAGEMAYALKQDIFQFNVESVPELELLNQVALAQHKKARVAIRVNPDVDPKTHAKISTGQKTTKFGVDMNEALAVYGLAKNLPAIEIQGVSIHIGSQLTSIEPFAQAFARIRAFVGELRAAGFNVGTLDLGGGLGIPYGKDAAPTPQAYAETVRREIGDIGCRLIFEPGRMLAGNAGILVTRVIYVKKGGGRTFVIVDAGMNDLIRPALYDAHHEIVPVIIPPPTGGRLGGGHPSSDGTSSPPPQPSPYGGGGILVDVVGPVCETGDIFAEQRMLAPCQAGDLLALRSAGAYGAAMAGNYNARPLIAEAMVSGDQFAIVRARQAYDDLIARDTLPGWL